MPTIPSINLPLPKSWEELETIVWDLFRHVWMDPYAVRHGRSGQRQHGVDIYGYPHEGGGLEGVQVKGRDSRYGDGVTETELQTEVGKALAFEPKLSRFVLVTSAPRDANIQKVARQITESHSAEDLCNVVVFGWQDVEERLAAFPDLIRLYYPQFFPRTDSPTAELLKAIYEQQLREAEVAEDRDRPRFEVTSNSVTNTEADLIPRFKTRLVSGDPVPAIQWRFRGPRFRMEWRQVAGSQLDRVTLQESFDLSRAPGADGILNVDEMGLELRFFWRRAWRHEIHRWPITRSELPNKVHWDVGAEILPPSEFDADGG